MLKVSVIIVFYTASELQSWLLYYSLPCLVGYLPDKYLFHFAHLSEGIYILLSDAITPTQLGRARDLLLTFYKDFQSLYGKKFWYVYGPFKKSFIWVMLHVILINKDATPRMFVLMFVWNKFIKHCLLKRYIIMYN